MALIDSVPVSTALQVPLPNAEDDARSAMDEIKDVPSCPGLSEATEVHGVSRASSPGVDEIQEDGVEENIHVSSLPHPPWPSHGPPLSLDHAPASAVESSIASSWHHDLGDATQPVEVASYHINAVVSSADDNRGIAGAVDTPSPEHIPTPTAVPGGYGSFTSHPPTPSGSDPLPPDGIQRRPFVPVVGNLALLHHEAVRSQLASTRWVLPARPSQVPAAVNLGTQSLAQRASFQQGQTSRATQQEMPPPLGPAPAPRPADETRRELLGRPTGTTSPQEVVRHASRSIAQAPPRLVATARPSSRAQQSRGLNLATSSRGSPAQSVVLHESVHEMSSETDSVVDLGFNRSSPVPPVVEEDDDDCSSRPRGTGPKALPCVDPLIVQHICRRFPDRVARARELSRRPPLYGVAYRDVLRLRIIGGALADLGLGTSQGDRTSVSVHEDGRSVDIHRDEVMLTLGMRPKMTSGSHTRAGAPVAGRASYSTSYFSSYTEPLCATASSLLLNLSGSMAPNIADNLMIAAGAPFSWTYTVYLWAEAEKPPYVAYIDVQPGQRHVLLENEPAFLEIWRRAGMWGYQIYVAEHDRWLWGHHALPMTPCLYRKPFLLARVDEIENCLGLSSRMAEAIGLLSRDLPTTAEAVVDDLLVEEEEDVHFEGEA
ncbi:hypothetical protein K466DRAFT_599242 [Polyporus arcularius HHB13444]|uniref:Uncharacterized protein n=1 Tax=Polyporus arcularius HHB13444 TaxID=1314778 RepID=A0A5C3PEP3_9APHY|nr:hypothetical protein K466DRAFT_599242 [Polyporus arcularius HHB13444]